MGKMDYAFTCKCKCLFGRYIRDGMPIEAACPLCSEVVTDAFCMSRTFGTRPHNLLPDIGEYKSPIDGTVVSSRSTHRDHMRQHNVIEVGNERLKPPADRAPMPRAGNDIKRSLEELRSR
jgi:hypothetical protein